MSDCNYSGVLFSTKKANEKNQSEFRGKIHPINVSMVRLYVRTEQIYLFSLYEYRMDIRLSQRLTRYIRNYVESRNRYVNRTNLTEKFRLGRLKNVVVAATEKRDRKKKCMTSIAPCERARVHARVPVSTFRCVYLYMCILCILCIQNVHFGENFAICHLLNNACTLPNLCAYSIYRVIHSSVNDGTGTMMETSQYIIIQ